jgi:hypothetical protein
MRLTNQLRSEILNSVMADTKRVDHMEQARKRAEAVVLFATPKVIRAAYEFDPSVFRTASAYIECAYIGYPHLVGQAVDLVKEDEKVRAAVKAHSAQKHRLDAAEKVVKEQLAACSTTEQFARLLPELAKYVPTVTPKKNLPVVTDAVSKLVAAGWPK